MEGTLCRVSALIAIDTRLKAASGGSRLDTERSNAIGGVRRAVPNRVLVIPDITDRREAKSVSSTRCAARSLRQKDGDSPGWWYRAFKRKAQDSAWPQEVHHGRQP